MITRTVRLQVLAFLLVSTLGLAFVGIRYLGLGDRLLGGAYTVYADFATGGGIFKNASVTYRGVPVGTVRAVGLQADGVRVELRLQRGVKVPADLTAVVADRSAVGEQYVDLRPNTDTGPYLSAGSTIARNRTSTPLPVETLLANLDALVRSIGTDNLTVVIDELGTAFEGNEAALRRLLDANSALLSAAQQHLPQTLALVRDGRTVLETQAASADEIRRWAAALAKLSGTLRSADPDLRRLLANGPPAANEVTQLLRGLDPAIGTLLGNLVTVNGIAVRRLAGIEQLLVVYPMTLAGGFTVTPGDGTAHLGLVVNVNDPPGCNYQRSGQTHCTAAEHASGAGVRGPDRAPRPSGESSTTGAAGYDPATGLVTDSGGDLMQFGGTGGQYGVAGQQSWKQLLLSGLAP